MEGLDIISKEKIEKEKHRVELRRLRKIKAEQDFKASLSQFPFIFIYFMFWFYVFTFSSYVTFKYLWFGDLKTLDLTYQLLIISAPFNFSFLVVPLTRRFRERISRRGVYTFSILLVLGIYPMYIILQEFFKLF